MNTCWLILIENGHTIYRQDRHIWKKEWKKMIFSIIDYSVPKYLYLIWKIETEIFNFSCNLAKFRRWSSGLIIETLFYCWRMHMGNYSRVIMVITSENNEFTTSGRRPRVQGYSERQDFSPFPLLETYSFFLIWDYTKRRCPLHIFLLHYL